MRVVEARQLVRRKGWRGPRRRPPPRDVSVGVQRQLGEQNERPALDVAQPFVACVGECPLGLVVLENSTGTSERRQAACSPR